MADSSPITVRTVRREDGGEWRPMWDAYNAFHGRSGDTALPEAITDSTWERFYDPAEPVHALVAEAARAKGCSRVYWQTRSDNAAGRALYDKVAAHHGFIVYSKEL